MFWFFFLNNDTFIVRGFTATGHTSAHMHLMMGEFFFCLWKRMRSKWKHFFFCSLLMYLSAFHYNAYSHACSPPPQQHSRAHTQNKMFRFAWCGKFSMCTVVCGVDAERAACSAYYYYGTPTPHTHKHLFVYYLLAALKLKLKHHISGVLV